MTSEVLADARSKLEHARSHFELLMSEGLAWAEANTGAPPPLTKTYDEGAARFTWALARPAPLPARWSLIIGDFLGNARAALDHLAWALSTLRQQTPPQPTRLSFPIVTGPTTRVTAEQRWQQVRTKNLQNIDAVLFVPMIRRHQPFTLGSHADQHPLAALDRLCQTDKHRRLHVVQAMPLEVQMVPEVYEASHFTVEGQRYHRPATGQPGTLLAEVWGRPDGKGTPDVRVRFPPWRVAPIIEGEFLMEGVCQGILAYVHELLCEFEAVLD